VRVTGELVTRGEFRPEFVRTARMVGSTCSVVLDAGLVSPSPYRMTETGVLDPDWGEARPDPARLLLFLGILRGGIWNWSATGDTIAARPVRVAPCHSGFSTGAAVLLFNLRTRSPKEVCAFGPELTLDSFPRTIPVSLCTGRSAAY
jgi:hypothetical protein